VLDDDGELDLLLLGQERLARRGLQVQPKVVGVVGSERSGWFRHSSPLPRFSSSVLVLEASPSAGRPFGVFGISDPVRS
jgi:hypothetical protein